jgi:hypothetical protein
VRAVRADRDRQLDIVVHDQGDACGAAQLEQRGALHVPQRRRCRLVPILDGRSTPRIALPTSPASARVSARSGVSA